MSDGISDARREERAATELRTAANRLCNALLEVHDAAFGYPPGALEIVNACLNMAQVEVLPIGERKP